MSFILQSSRGSIAGSSAVSSTGDVTPFLLEYPLKKTKNIEDV